MTSQTSKRPVQRPALDLEVLEPQLDDGSHTPPQGDALLEPETSLPTHALEGGASSCRR